MSKLFEPLSLGSVKLENRIAMAPLTRYRADDEWVPLPMAKAAVPGTLLISEATLISKASICRHNIPGIFNDAQTSRWKEITDAVHEKDSFIFCQIWHLGRAGLPNIYKEAGNKFLSSSAVPIDDTRGVPEEMTEEEIWTTIRDYATAAKNVIAAGFDGVELHGANGYLIDQFLQDNCNKRTDAWGGSIENRARFALEVTKAVVDAIGADKVGIRLSPFSDFQGMLMQDPYPQFEYIVKQLKPLGLAYLHLIEARIAGNADSACGEGHNVGFLVKLWDNQSPIILAGGFNSESALKIVDETYKDHDVVVAFGRYFISNPDLVFRLKEGINFTKYDRSTFYTPKLPEGYIDLPFCEQFRV
ncbi:NADH:flavin oxidoreductase/NADH oxidase [Xylariaceae sp. FL0255]|nr:NADH:flavin oxidoreductase/NADH oxidase [Xylariaceae sp. FL0255]